MSTTTSAPEQAIDYMHPAEECDLVMKGGITSGVVYPPAVLRLAGRYRFRAIGGTSAGAIAAAATAAAEYGREQDGFKTLESISRQLSQKGFLFSLFQPSPTTQPLMNTLVAMAAESRKDQPQAVPRLLRSLTTTLFKERRSSFVKGALLGAALPSVYTLLTRGSLKQPGLMPPLVIFGWLGALLKSGYDLSQILLKEMPKNNFFGMCTGLNDETGTRGDVLTEWLSGSINELAGRAKDAEPLTFRELSEKQIDGKNCGISLRTVTTNLSEGRPYVIPFDTNTFLFNADEMRRIFPESVVAYMIKQSHPSKSVGLDNLPGYYFLPSGDDLPVIVAARMSLSFPLLISAVPLYTIKQSVFHDRSHKPVVPSGPDDLHRNWFSDGGICSNFPIHFFDAWLPLRPTFGINLMSLPQEMFDDPGRLNSELKSSGDPDQMDAEEHMHQPEDAISRAIWLPPANVASTPEWTDLSSLFDFVKAIFSSAQNYRDTTQAMLPSYRERIVQVRFAPNEGGLNLAMDSSTIETIQQKGEKAAEKILDYFQFPHHQWVRFQVLMALLERQLKELEDALRDGNYEQMIAEQERQRAQADHKLWYPYPHDQDWCDEAIERIEALRTFVQQQNTNEWLVKQPPRPEPTLRVTPEL